MGIDICTLGGYSEVGRNCTAVKVDDEVIILDMGIHLESYIKFTEEREDIININPEQLIANNAVPNVNLIKDWKDKVIAIIPSHAHLDHIVAIPFLASRYKAPILCTPFTAAVIKAILKDAKMSLKNPFRTLYAGSRYKISKNIMVEFINATHSTPQTVMVALHTKYGVIIYANDFKFDSTPVLGAKPDFKRLQELQGKVLALISESTYAYEAIKMPSEAVARELLKEVMLGTDHKGKGLVVTTFSSHIARLKSIIEFGKRTNRKILFLGRSLAKYTYAAEDVGLVKFSKQVEIIKYSSKISQTLNKVMKQGKQKYLLVVTGHQGEPTATLSKMIDGKYDFKFGKDDHVIFSCKVIPTKTNMDNRAFLEKKLGDAGVRIFRDIHVSGHAGREDLRDLINLVKPQHLIPSHGEPRMTNSLAELAMQMGYKSEQLHVSSDGAMITLLP